MTGIFSASSSYSSAAQFAVYGDVTTINDNSISQPYYLNNNSHGQAFSGYHNIGNKLIAHVTNGGVVEFNSDGSVRKNVSATSASIGGYISASCHPSLEKLYVGISSSLVVLDMGSVSSSTASGTTYSSSSYSYSSLGVSGLTTTVYQDKIAVSYTGNKIFACDTNDLFSISLDSSGIPNSSNTAKISVSSPYSFSFLAPLPNGNIAAILKTSNPSNIFLRIYDESLQLVQDYGSITTNQYASSNWGGVFVNDTELYISTSRTILRYILGNQYAVEIAGNSSSSPGFIDGFGANASMVSIDTLFFFNNALYFWDSTRFRRLT